MKEKEKFKFVEYCLYNYIANIAKINKLCEKKSNMRFYSKNERSLITISHGGEASNLPLMYVQNLEYLEKQIEEVEKQVEPIKELLQYLTLNESKRNKVYLEIVNLFYFDGKNRKETCDALKISHVTFHTRRKELINLAMKYFGL